MHKNREHPRCAMNKSTDEPMPVDCTGGIIWEVEGRGSGGKGVAYHIDSPTQVEVFDLGW